MRDVPWHIFLKLSNFFCMLPILPEGHGKSGIQTLYILRMLIFGGLYLTCQCIICADKMQKKAKILNEIIFVCCTLYISFISVHAQLRSVFKSYSINNFYYRLIDIRKYIEHNNPASFYSSVLMQLLYLLFVLAYLVVIYFKTFDLYNALLYTFGFTLPKLAVIISTHLFANFVLLLRVYFISLNAQLDDCKDEKRSKELMLIYCKLVDATKLLNKIYGQQNLLAIGQYMVWVMYELYHLILLASVDNQHEHNKEEKSYLMMFAVSWILVQVSALMFLIFACIAGMSEAHKFVPMWHGVRTECNMNGDVHLSLKLLHENVNYLAMGWFNIDFNLLFTIIGTSATFLVIFTQFSKEL